MYVYFISSGLDWGGVSREFFELLCVRCFDPTYKLFQRFSDNPQALVSNTRNYLYIVTAFVGDKGILFKCSGMIYIKRISVYERAS